MLRFRMHVLSYSYGNFIVSQQLEPAFFVRGFGCALFIFKKKGN